VLDIEPLSESRTDRAPRPRVPNDLRIEVKRAEGPVMASAARVLRHEDYTVGWICALAREMAAAKAMLDQCHASLQAKENDSNTYQLDRIGSHNAVIACLP